MIRSSATLFVLALVLALPATAQRGNNGNGVGPGYNTDAPAQVRGLDGWQVDPVFTVGETIDGYQPPGIMDGIGAIELDRRTVRLFVNHELRSGRGPAYTLANGTTLRGARVSYFDINKNNRKLVDVGLAYDTIIDRAGNVVTAASDFEDLNRLCSSVLFEAGTFGLVDDIYFTGEETGGGTEFALDVDNGVLYALPWLGRAAWENVTMLDTGDPNTVAILVGDDRGGAPLILYVGQKNANPDAPDFLDRNGLAQGELYVWVENNGALSPEDWSGTGTSRSGIFVRIDYKRDDLAGTAGYDDQGFATQAQQDRLAMDAGAFQFSRPEDLATNPDDATQVLFASTGRGSLFPSDDWGTTYLIDVDFGLDVIAADLEILYDGDDAGGSVYDFAGPDYGLRSPDNLDWADNGLGFIQEDRSTGAFGATSGEEASIWMLDPGAFELTRIAQIVRGALPEGQAENEEQANEIGVYETSGILDVTALFNTPPGEVLLVGDVQAHATGGGSIDDGDLQEGGQLFFLSARDIPPVANRGASSEAARPATNATVAESFTLDGSYPNPVRARATVGFTAAESGPVTLRLYDVLGREVRTLVDATVDAGAHTVRLDVTGLASGVYVLRMQTPQQSFARQVLVVE